jgi:soluble lytic murein transglycosylase
MVSASAAQAERTTLSGGEAATYRAALRAAHAGKWAPAMALVRHSSDRVLAKVIAWLHVVHPGTDASFDEIAGFIKANPDWPKPKQMFERAEEAITDDMPSARVRAWFEAHPPVSAAGKIRYAEALLATGDTKNGTALLRQAWVESNLGDRQEMTFLFKHRAELRAEDDVARLDRLLWDGQSQAARAMLKRVDKGHAAVAEARLRLQEMSSAADYALRQVPDELRGDPGLAFDRLRWHRRKGLDDQAREILLHPPAELVRPEHWWQERDIEIHRALAAGYYSEALRMAELHGQTPATPSYADAEWIAGWIALRMLKEPATALAHFRTMDGVVQYPSSRARAAYWIGRSLESTRAGRDADQAYKTAALYSATYYGQLAAQRLDPAVRPGLPRPPEPTTAERNAFNARELVRAARELGEIGEDELHEVFIKRLAMLTTDPVDRELVANLALAGSRPNLVVRLARQIWHGEMPVTMHGYPVRTLPTTSGAEGALVLAVIRQESAFDPKAISPAGALGLMQLMPPTARKTAGGLGVRFVSSKLTGDPDYNIRIGSAFLRQLVDDFSGSYVLAVAAYNAGPGRVREWMRENGDPRAPQVDVVDWIEMIPFEETRNYVQRVLEGLNVYRERLAGGRNADKNIAAVPIRQSAVVFH